MAKKKLLEVIEDMTSFAIKHNLLDGKPVIENVIKALDKRLEMEIKPPSEEKLNAWKKLGTHAVLHCSSDRAVGKIIKEVTGSKYSHTAIFLLIAGVPFVFESQAKKGFHKIGFKEWVEKWGYDYTATDATGKFTYSDIEPHLGKKYDFLTLGKHLAKSVTKQWLKDNESDKRLVCSEGAGLVMKFPNAEELTPADVRKLCSTHKVLLELWEN